MVQRSQVESFWKSWPQERPDDQEQLEKLRNRLVAVIKSQIWPRIPTTPHSGVNL